MNLTEKDVQMFEQLSRNQTGKWLVDYFERLEAYLLDPESVNKDNVEVRKETILLSREHFTRKIKTSGQGKKVDNSQYV